MGSDRLPVARVLIDSPLPQLDRLFDYRVPSHLTGEALPGVRVRVPLRSAGRVADGFIIEVNSVGEFDGALSEIESVVSTLPVLAPDVWALARRAADRAAGSAIDIVRLAVPKRQVRLEKQFLRDRPVDARSVAEQPITANPIIGYGSGRLEAALVAHHRLAIDAIPLPQQLPGGVWVGAWAVLMAGAAASTIASGESAILAVPDYRDQDQLEAALHAVLPDDRIVRVDARQGNAERYAAFLQCLSGRSLVIVGNRSAVYSPAFALGLIAVWDDGDPMHSEPLGPYVHTRDAALLRQELSGCALAFVGHARSTEVQRLVEIGWLQTISPNPAVLPRIVPTANQAGGERMAERARIPSSAWQIATRALRQGPVLVQVAQPGYSPRLACAQCHEGARCQICEGPLTQRMAGAVPACGWCGALAASWRCGHCGSERFRSIGAGAARTAEELGRAFPGVRVMVSDGQRVVRLTDAEPVLVIATRGAEPVAPGGYRAVLLLDGERMLARESLRVAEDCLRWWSNAIALAGPGAPSVLVGVGGSLATTLVTWRQSAFASSELADRRELRFPPAVRVATVAGSTATVTATVAAAVGALDFDASDVLGPVETAPGTIRTILRFDYARGLDVAAILRAEVVRSAVGHRRRPGDAPGRRTSVPSLRVRFDDIEPFLEP